MASVDRPCEVDLTALDDVLELDGDVGRDPRRVDERDPRLLEAVESRRQRLAAQGGDEPLLRDVVGVLEEPVDPGPSRRRVLRVNADGRLEVAVDLGVECSADLVWEGHEADVVGALARLGGGQFQLRHRPRAEQHGRDFTRRQHNLRLLPARRHWVGLVQPALNDVEEQPVGDTLDLTVGPRGLVLGEVGRHVGDVHDPALAVPDPEGPAVLVVGVVGDGRRLGLDGREVVEELLRAGGGRGDPRLLPDALVVGHSLRGATQRQAIDLAVVGLLVDEAVGLVQVIDRPERLEERRQLVLGDLVGNEDYVAVVAGGESVVDLAVVGEGLELHRGPGVLRAELLGVLDEVRVDEVGAVGEHGDLALDLTARLGACRTRLRGRARARAQQESNYGCGPDREITLPHADYSLCRR